MAPAQKTPKAAKPAKAPKPPKPKAQKKPRVPKGAKAAAPKAISAPKALGPGSSPAPVAAAPMSAVWPESTRPSLMFLPPKIRGARSRRRANQKASICALVLLGLAGVAYVSVAAGTSAASADLEAAHAVTAEHNRFLQEHSAFQNYYDGFIEQKSEVAGILASDTAYSKVMKAVNEANTVGAVFTSINTIQGQTGCPSPDLFSPSPAVGCLDISGTAKSLQDVAALAAALGSSTEFLAHPYVTESSEAPEEGSPASFKLSVGYTDKAFSFAGEKFRPTSEELASITQPAAPAAAPTEEAAQ